MLPELVDEHEDERVRQVKTMKYANTVGLLIEAVKDLSKQVEELPRLILARWQILTLNQIHIEKDGLEHLVQHAQ